MKYFAATLLLVLALSTVANAGEKESPFKAGPKNCYEYSIQTLPRGDYPVMIFNVAEALTKGKDLQAVDVKSLDNASDLGKSIQGRLSKLPDVDRVLISHRQIIITKYPFPKTWEQLSPEVLKIMDQVVCK